MAAFAAVPAAFGGASRYPRPGDVIDGKYRVERLLGQGGMGVVAAATHLVRRAPVALKFIDPDLLARPGCAARFVNEAIVASRLDSEHVVRIFDVGRLPDGAPFLVMELLDGVDLERRLQAQPGGRFGVAQAVHYVLQILRALQVAHAAGVVHRDLKPSNAFVVARDGAELVKLLDFGISRDVESDGGEAGRLTKSNVALGTPLYISPEQARDAHNATPRSDLYSVGTMLFELLSGHTPFEASTASGLLFKLFTQEPRPLLGARPGLPPALAAVVHMALAKEPAARPADAAHFARLLAPFAEARSAHVPGQLLGSPGSAAEGAYVARAPESAGVARTVRAAPPAGADGASPGSARADARPAVSVGALAPSAAEAPSSVHAVVLPATRSPAPSGAGAAGGAAGGGRGARAARWRLAGLAAAAGVALGALFTTERSPASLSAGGPEGAPSGPSSTTPAPMASGPSTPTTDAATAGPSGVVAAPIGEGPVRVGNRGGGGPARVGAPGEGGPARDGGSGGEGRAPGGVPGGEGWARAGARGAEARASADAAAPRAPSPAPARGKAAVGPTRANPYGFDLVK